MKDPDFIYPMKAMDPILLPKKPTSFLFQPKFNGWGVIVNKGKVFTRRSKEITNWKAFKELNFDFPHPLHCELLGRVYGKNYSNNTTAQIRSCNATPIFMIHDLMISDVPALQRQKMIEELKLPVGFEKSDYFLIKNWKSVNKLYLNMVYMIHHEGLVMKNIHSHYILGEYACVQTMDWMRIKSPIHEE